MKKITLLSLFALSLLLFLGCPDSTSPDESAELIVISIPVGAAIYLDAVLTGEVTPATLEIDTGNHELRLELAGFQDYVETFDVGDGDTHNVNAIMAVATTNTSLSVITTPPGASVYIDGAYTWELTPFTLTTILPGNHNVRIYKGGYNEVDLDITLLEDIPYTINEFLTAPVPPYPVFTIYSPYNGETFSDNVITIDGYIELDTGASYTGDNAILAINGVDSEIYVSSGYFSETISIAAGENYLHLRANGPEGDTGVSDVITVNGDFLASEIEVVLSWNTPTSDIDLHTWNPAGEHCFYSNKIISDGSLDIDDTNGFGPETFAVPTANTGVYEIQVNCYSLHSDDYSDASIQVFFDGVLMETYGPHNFIVDDYNGTDPEAWWQVCTITVEGGRCMISNDKPTQIVQEKIRLDKVNLPRK